MILSYGDSLKETKSPASPPASDEAKQSGAETDSKNSAELEFAKRIKDSGLLPASKLELIKPATYGEPVWPILSVILAVTGLIGTLAGFGIVLVIFLISRGLAIQTAGNT